MRNPISQPSPETLAFVAAITDKSDPAETAAFVAAITGEDSYVRHESKDGKGRGTTEMSQAEWLDIVLHGFHEHNFNPDQPRAPDGEWTADGSTSGTKENGYNGLGTWALSSEQQAEDFFNDLLKPKQNNFPDGWLRVRKGGCFGLNLLRIGWRGAQPPNALFSKGAKFYANPGSAGKELAALSKAHPDKTYTLFAAQMPTRGNGGQIAKSWGDGQVNIMKMTGKLNLDMNRRADYNFSTWFPTPDGRGYWEYMNRHWKTVDPKDPPAVKHQPELPDLGKEFLTVYGVVEKQPFPK